MDRAEFFIDVSGYNHSTTIVPSPPSVTQTFFQPTTSPMKPTCVPPSSLFGIDPYPAFFAQRTASLTNFQDTGEIVVITYDEMLVNEAGGFDIKTGIFTVPIRGIYYFYFWSSYCAINAIIVKNKIERISLALIMHNLTTTKNTECAFPAHAQATLLLEVGDQVSVQLNNSGRFLHITDNSPIGDSLSFTGFLLHSFNKVKS